MAQRNDPAITPDAKDWTWVLTRPCPECGFDPRAFPREQVGAMTRENAAAWPALLRGGRVAQRPEPQVWSALEYACHVRDVFQIFDERLRLMLTVDGPRYANWDQDETSVEDRYAEQDPGAVADELQAAAATLADRFDSVVGDQWSRTGYRSDGADFTVESFARYFIHDPVHHLREVADRAR
jgi:hypothetical protein